MNKLYYNLPYFMKVIATSVVAKYKFNEKYGNYFKSYFKFLTENDIKIHDQKSCEEFEEFIKIIKKENNFYKIPVDFNLNNIPIIDKSKVLLNYEKILREKPYKIVKSSGTSGCPLPVPYSQNVYQKEYAFWWYHRSFGNVKMGDRIATFAGHKIADVNHIKPPFWVYNYTENQMFFSSYHLSQKNLNYYLKQLNYFKPVFIHGYPSSIYIIAKYIIDNNIKLDFMPKMITTASETTLDFQRTAIEKAFKCKLYVWYGNTEYCGHITECPNGKLHVQPYHSKIRVLNQDDKDVKAGEEGRIVATNFSNYSFPLINYDTKDVVKISNNQTCSCKKGGLILDYIIGRIEDYIINSDGRFIGRLDHLFKDAKYVKNAQIEQRKLDQLIIRIEKENQYSYSIEQSIFNEAKNRLGNNFEIIFEYVNEIEKDKNGKFKFVVQKLKKNSGGTN